MWIVAKYNSGQSQMLKENLSKALGDDVEFYQPKIMIELRKKKFFKNILGNYVFCRHSSFYEDKILNNLKFIKGLSYFLSNCKLEQKQILNFIYKCKSHEGKNDILSQTFFDELVDLKAKFISGPFKSFAFEIINKNKNYFITKINNFKITVKKKNRYFLPL